MERYRKITETDLKYNQNIFDKALETTMTINKYSEKIDSFIYFANYDKQPYMADQISNNAYNKVFVTGLYKKTRKMCHKKTTAKQNCKLQKMLCWGVLWPAINPVHKHITSEFSLVQHGHHHSRIYLRGLRQPGYGHDCQKRCDPPADQNHEANWGHQQDYYWTRKYPHNNQHAPDRPRGETASEKLSSNSGKETAVHEYKSKLDPTWCCWTHSLELVRVPTIQTCGKRENVQCWGNSETRELRKGLKNGIPKNSGSLTVNGSDRIFCGNGEREIPIYASARTMVPHTPEHTSQQAKTTC